MRLTRRRQNLPRNRALDLVWNRVVVRRENASTVKVVTSILGVELGSTLQEAHARLDKLSDPATPPKEEKKGGDEAARGTHKVLWIFAETDYSAVFIKTDDEQRIASIGAIVRPGKEQPFDKIGEVEKAPIRSDAQGAWDVIRPGRPLFRVVAQGTESKASTINIFLVQRDGPAQQPGE